MAVLVAVRDADERRSRDKRRLEVKIARGPRVVFAVLESGLDLDVDELAGGLVDADEIECGGERELEAGDRNLGPERTQSLSDELGAGEERVFVDGARIDALPADELDEIGIDGHSASRAAGTGSAGGDVELDGMEDARELVGEPFESDPVSGLFVARAEATAERGKHDIGALACAEEVKRGTVDARKGLGRGCSEKHRTEHAAPADDFCFCVHVGM